MTDIQPLISYLKEHDLVDEPTALKLSTISDRDLLVESLQQSGLLSQSDILRLESLFSGYPRVSHAYIVDPLVQSAVPYETSQAERIVCVRKDDKEVCVITDKNTLNQDMVQALFPQSNVHIERTDKEHIDSLLSGYKEHTHDVLVSSIEQTASRVRDIDRYGSAHMALFFPEDHKREIAEDLSTRKLIRSIVKLAEIKQATTISFESHTDKILVRMRIAGKVHDIVVLPKKVQMPLVLSFLYVCDMPLQDIEQTLQTETNLLQELGHAESMGVVIAPTVTGCTITLSFNTHSALKIGTQELGMNEEDAMTLQRMYEQKKGLITITGRSLGGKTFAWYQLLQIARPVGIVEAREDVIEYVIDGVNQSVWSKQPAKDLQRAIVTADVLAVRPLHEGLALAVANASQHKLVITETSEGMIGFIKNLLKQGVRGKEVARLCGSNLVTTAFKEVRQENKKQIRLSPESIATLENYISRSEIQKLLMDQGLVKNGTLSLEKIEWVSSSKQVTLWNKIIRGVQDTIESQENTVFVRSLVDIQQIIEQSERKGESIFELEKAIKEKQKESLVRMMIVRAYKHEIAIEDVINTLRA